MTTMGYFLSLLLLIVGFACGFGAGWYGRENKMKIDQGVPNV